MTDANIVIGIRGETAGARRIRRELDTVDKKAKGVTKSTNLLKGALVGLGGLAVVSAFRRLVTSASNFERSIAEINTIIADQSKFIGLEENLRAINRQFGGDRQAQAKALYDIISAGASDAAEATEILDTANRLAIGGVSDIRVAADGLTSVLNAYGDAVDGARDVSDTFFIAVQGGKTTVDELSNSIGLVAPLAASANVSLQELSATVAALTAGGIDTSIAIQGIRQVLSNVVKPTSQAAAEAERLGIEFNTARLNSLGFAGFLEEVIDKTGGSSDSLAQLFGSVEALVPILALTGEAGGKLNSILAAMENRAGATDRAFAVLNKTFGQQFSQFIAKVSDKLLTLASVVTVSLTPVLMFLNDNFETITATMGALAFATVPLLVKAFATAIPAAISLTTAAFKALTVAIATNPIGAIAVAISVAVGAFITFQDRIKGALSDVEIFGTRGIEIFFLIKNTAIEVFDALIDTIRRPFLLAVAAFRDTVNQMKRIANTIPGVDFDTFEGSSFVETLRSFGEEDFDRVNKILQSTKEDLAEFDSEGSVDKLGKDLDVASAAAEKVKSSVDDVRSSVDRIGESAGNAFSGFVTGARSAGDAVRSLTNDIINMVAQKTIAAPISGAISSFVGGLFAGGAPAANPGNISNPSAQGPAFNTGGSFMINGKGGVDMNQLSLNGSPIARVSKGEQIDIKSRKSQEQQVVVNVINNSRSGVDVKETRQGNGNKNIEVVIDETVARNISTPGTKTSRALRGITGDGVGRR